MLILKGAEVSEKIKIKVQVMLKTWHGKVPKLAIVRVGANPDDVSYEKNAVKKMEAFGLSAQTFTFPADITEKNFLWEFEKINQDGGIHGILLLRPLPRHIDERRVERMIDPSKDLDGISPSNVAKVFSGDLSGFAPCTAEAVMEVLKANDISVTGKRVTIVGRSMVVGKPLAMLLMKEDATITVCHTKTLNLAATCRQAEILVAAAGKAGMIDSSFVGKDAVVIDVGINVDPEGRLRGDVDFQSVSEVASMITPVPGGVGGVTTAVLAKHLVKAACQ